MTEIPLKRSKFTIQLTNQESWYLHGHEQVNANTYMGHLYNDLRVGNRNIQAFSNCLRNIKLRRNLSQKVTKIDLALLIPIEQPS